MENNLDIYIRLTRNIAKMQRNFARANSNGILGKGQMHVLNTIKKINQHSEKGATVSDIAQEMFMSLPAVSQKLRGLEELGLITRVLDKADRRIAYLQLTQVGEDNLRESTEFLAQKVQEMLKDIDVEEVENFVETLRKFNRATAKAYQEIKEEAKE